MRLFVREESMRSHAVCCEKSRGLDLLDVTTFQYLVVLTAFAVLTIQDHGMRVPVYNSRLFKYSRFSASLTFFDSRRYVDFCTEVKMIYNIHSVEYIDHTTAYYPVGTLTPHTIASPDFL